MATSQPHTSLPLPRFADNKPHLLIVLSPYYNDIAQQLLEGAINVITQCEATYEIAQVPGALEIPIAISLASNSDRFQGFVALGCVIRGETTHYDTVCNDSSRGLTELGLHGICLGNGILTVENRQQAEVRADRKGQNKGGGAAEAALHLISLSERFRNRSKGIGFKPASEHIHIAGTPSRKPRA